jgi:flagellar biosynthesis protein FlhA
MATAALPNAGISSSPTHWQDLILPVSMIASVLVIIVPVPPALLDILLSTNITLSVIILLTTVYVRTPLEFSVFPSLLLATTLARLVLNVATTRLILTRAPTDGPLAAGHVVQAFGNFVAGNQLVVGMIIFVIIVIIQFVVITKGATRISEVAARFALDGMPGRQMAIDADLNAGSINEVEARRRRSEITQQADFFGAMDGASKFVRGDAIAAILITLINIFGGLIIGMVQGGMGFTQAADVFTKLTIGDGLVSQVPAFLISLATGLLVTRSNSDTNLPSEFLRQLFSRPQALAVAGAFLGILIFTNLPTIPLALIGGSCVGMALMLSREKQQADALAATKASNDAKKKPEERIEDYLTTDPMEIEIGLGLIRLADPKRGGDLLQRIQRVRQALATDMGMIMPKVRIRDNMLLEQTQYRIKIAGVSVAEGTLEPVLLLAIESAALTGKVRGIATREPALNKPATWIESSFREQAELFGYTVVEPAGVLVTHLTETVRKHADEILTRDAAKHLIDELRKSSPATIEELIPGQMKLAEVQRILQMMLREQVPIRQLDSILETLGDYAPRTKDPLQLTEYVRHRLARAICARYRDADDKLRVVTIDPDLEENIKAGIDHTERGLSIRMSPQAVEETCQLLGDAVEELARQNRPPVVLVSPQIRAGLKQLTAARLPQLVVLSYSEITRDTQIESVAMVSEANMEVQSLVTSH